jgi:predicted enzyme related to lactoylglutathione lyase
MTDYAAGTPSWVELSTKDPDGSYAFYSELFGWTATEGSEEFGGYRTFLDGGRSVGGLNPMGEFPVWATYVATDDADATAEKVGANGGTVMVPPMDVGDLGRMAVFVDPAGAVFGVWQAKEMKGADKVNEPYSFCWNELHARGFDGVKPFYGAVFGWDPQPFGPPSEGQPPYFVWNLGDRGIGGGMEMEAGAPDEVPSYWLTWFAVEDRDATVEQAQALGASVLMTGMEMPGVGKMAVLSDPQGATFGILQGEQPDE